MLYVVATPIGNLGDMTPRAVEVLKSVDLIAAEDTRMTMKLTQHFGIATPLTSCHRHNEFEKAEQLVRRMQEENISVALVTDAGTPAISDPGTHLVRLAAEAGIEVLAVPGPTAMASAMSVSGIETEEFTFLGFLPREKKDLKEALLDASQRLRTVIVHESPYRVLELMRTLKETVPEAYVSVSCDLTKLHELTLRGNVGDVLAQMEANEKTEKGEYCIVIDFHLVKKEEETEEPLTLEAQLIDLMIKNDIGLRDASRLLMEKGAKKNAVYSAGLRLKGLFSEEE